jgi:hypothetical protein
MITRMIVFIVHQVSDLLTTPENFIKKGNEQV